MRGAIILPIILFLGSVASYIVLLIASAAHPGSTWTTRDVYLLNTISWSFSTGVEVIAATLIAVRLILHRIRLREALDRESYKDYTSTPNILLESAAIYAAAGIATITVVALRNELTAVFVPIFGMTQVRTLPSYCAEHII